MLSIETQFLVLSKTPVLCTWPYTPKRDALQAVFPAGR